MTQYKTQLQVFLVMTLLSSNIGLAAGKSSNKKPTVQPTTTSKAVKVDGSLPSDDVVSGSSTRIDFSETSIDGKMKAPDGFFLQGHNSNSLSQMVKLRSNFRNELRNSSSAVKSHVK